jgi:hypothetical protein
LELHYYSDSDILKLSLFFYQVSSLGFIPLVIASIAQHKAATDVVKSACHTLAILSDVKGQASTIAVAGLFWFESCELMRAFF